VLATQNPVDLDYKGLGNAGTWFIGRLQTERDRERVIEGLLGSDAAQGLDRGRLTSLMANLSQRTFLMRNVHDDAPALFRSRWAMSYLRGPLTLMEIGRLASESSGGDPPVEPAGGVATPRAAATGDSAASAAAGTRPVFEAGVSERFRDTGTAAPTYRPHVGARVRAHFTDARAGLDAWETRYYLAAAGGAGPDWSTAEVFEESAMRLSDAPAAGAGFAAAPGALLSPRAYRTWTAMLADHAYRNLALEVYRCPSLKRTAAPGGTEGDFRAALAQELRARYAKKLAAVVDRERRAEQRVERERAQATSETTSSVLSVGGSVLGALFGRRGGTLAGASSAARRLGRISKERADVEHAESDVRSLREQAAAIEAELHAEIAALGARYDPATIDVESVTVRPRKSDLAVEDLALVWSA
jgi:hypothetical protein